MEKLSSQIHTEQKESEPDIETQEPQAEDLDFWTLSFLKEHIDMPDMINFDPERELELIKKAVSELPKEEQSNQRFFLIRDFKKKIKVFRENMAQAQLEFEQFLKINPDAKREDILKKIDEITDKNQVRSQKLYFARVVSKYLESHGGIGQTVNQYKKNHSDTWQQELFKTLFGRYPKGDIEIDTMPVNLYIKFNNLEDYALAHGSSEEVARRSGGAALNGKKFEQLPALSGKILIENSAVLKELKESGLRTKTTENIKAHEEEHSIHRQFYPRSVFIKGEQAVFSQLGNYEDGAIDLPDLHQLTEKYSHAAILEFQDSAKSEVLANMKEYGDLIFILKSLTKKDGLYNYLEQSSDYTLKGFLLHLKAREIKVKKDNGKYMNDKEITDILSEKLTQAWDKEYIPVVTKAVMALQELFDKYKHDPGKYPQLLRLASQEPLNKWPRLAKILS